VKFLAVDKPEAKDLTVGTMTLVAQQARKAISERTKEALAAARARVVKLGEPRRRSHRVARILCGIRGRSAVLVEAGSHLSAGTDCLESV